MNRNLKSFLLSGYIGFTLGTMLNTLVLIIYSQKLKLGYCAACITWLPEHVGGEINGALVEFLFCGMVGLVIALIIRTIVFRCQKSKK